LDLPFLLVDRLTLISPQFAFQNDNYLFYVFEFAAGGMLFYHLVSYPCT